MPIFKRNRKREKADKKVNQAVITFMKTLIKVIFLKLLYNLNKLRVIIEIKKSPNLNSNL